MYTLACCSRPVIEGILEGSPSSTQFREDYPNKEGEREGHATHDSSTCGDVGEEELI